MAPEGPQTLGASSVPDSGSSAATVADATHPKGEVDTPISDIPGCVVEVFAGTAVLTKAMTDRGLHSEQPQDANTGGFDFRDPKQVEAAMTWLTELASTRGPLAIHLAPLCSTFSRARNRAARTRVRSSSSPCRLRAAPPS